MQTMIKSMRLIISLLAALLFPFLLQASFLPEQSIIEIEITKKVYDYRQPWTASSQTGVKNGLVIEGRKILTTADGLNQSSICRIRKGGESRQYSAEVLSIDYQANIALLGVENETFWVSVRPIELARKLPQSGTLQIYRWRSGRIEERSAEIVRLYVGTSKLSDLSQLTLLASSEINSAGWAEVAIKGNKLIGLTTSGSKNKQLTILPATAIMQALERGPCGQGSGHGFFDFYWMPANNPHLLTSKGYDPEKEQGVVVTEANVINKDMGPLRHGDLILEIDGFPIEKVGKYMDPDYGRLSMEGLSTRRHAAGESIQMQIWRDGKSVEIEYVLPKADFDNALIPNYPYSRSPKYLIAGGLVFQPFDGSFLRALGDSTSLILNYYAEKTHAEDRESLVILSKVLPDDYNLGYENFRLLIVDSINGKIISSLSDVAQALANPPNGYHKIEFMHDFYMKHLVLEVETLTEATERILKNYRIPQAASDAILTP
jgi:hypothetical protein